VGLKSRSSGREELTKGLVGKRELAGKRTFFPAVVKLSIVSGEGKGGGTLQI